MKLGSISHLLTVEKLAGRRNEFGEIAEEWLPAFEQFFSIEPLTQVERDRAAAVGRQTTHRMTCHYHPDLNGKCRLRCGHAVYDIVSIINKAQENREFEITANEIEVEDGA